MKFAICDDNIKDAESLKHQCQKIGFSENIEYYLFTNGNEVIQNIKDSISFQLIFLDIEMPESNGIDIGRKIRELDEKAVIIFVTSYPEYAIDTFDCRPFHYLVKPCNDTKLKEVIDKAQTLYLRNHQFHIVKIGKYTRKIPISEIYYVEYIRKHVIYYTKDKSIDTVGKLENAYKDLSCFGFFRVHQAFIVNMDKIHSFEGKDVLLENGALVPVSARNRTFLRQAYAKYVMG